MRLWRRWCYRRGDDIIRSDSLYCHSLVVGEVDLQRVQRLESASVKATLPTVTILSGALETQSKINGGHGIKKNMELAISIHKHEK